VALDEAEAEIAPPPRTLPEIVFHLIGHRRSDGNPAQQWLRTLIESIAASI
jgi:hypothetical protein